MRSRVTIWVIAALLTVAVSYQVDCGVTPATTAPSIGDEYHLLLSDVEEYNQTSSGTVSNWLMNSEHLFLTSDDPLKPDLLQERVTKFSRLPGGLDLLVDRLLDKNCKADETLAISEILVFYGEVNLKGDEQVKSARAVEAIRQIENDSLADAEHRFPDAPIRRQLILALRKARPDPKSTTDQAASSRSK